MENPGQFCVEINSPILSHPTEGLAQPTSERQEVIKKALMFAQPAMWII